MIELLETMGTAPTRSCLEGQGETDKGMENRREGRMTRGARGAWMAGEGSQRGGARLEPCCPDALHVSVSCMKARPCTDSA